MCVKVNSYSRTLRNGKFISMNRHRILMKWRPGLQNWSNDLGYAKTFYPQSKVTLYLNKLASGIYLGIYKNKKEESSRIIRFWKTELPLVIRKHHRVLLYSFLIFLFFALVAAFSAANDQEFVRGVLGNDYVEMTEQNIAKGDPFGVYKDQDASFDVSLDRRSQRAGFFHDIYIRSAGRTGNDLADI